MPTNEAHKIDGIASIFNNSKGKIVLLHGPWGSGKTYRFENTIRKQTKGKFCYVSLYEIASVDDLKAIVFKKGIEHALEERKWWSWQSLGIVFSIVYIFLMPAVLWGEYTYLKMLALAPPLIIAVLYWYNNLGGTLSFLSSKYLGLNINACDIKRFLNPTDFSFCFDDFDRSKSELNGLLLGYFYRLAKEEGFNILVIDKSATVEKAAELGVEKVFDYDFRHDLVIDPLSLIEKESYPELEEALKFYILRLRQMYTEKNDYDENVQGFIEVIYSNLRLFQKILKNVENLNSRLEKGGGKSHITDRYVLEYIILLTISINVKIDRYFSSDIERNELRNSANMFSTKDENNRNKKGVKEFLENLTQLKTYAIYPQIYKEVTTGYSNVEKLVEELRDEDAAYTKLELLYKHSRGKSFVHYSSIEFQREIESWENCIKEETQAFSSLSMMKSVIEVYLSMICFIQTESSCMKALKRQIRQFAESHFEEYIEDTFSRKLINTSYLNYRGMSQFFDDVTYCDKLRQYASDINIYWLEYVIGAGLLYFSKKIEQMENILDIYRNINFYSKESPKMEILLIWLNKDPSILQAIFDSKFSDIYLYTELMWRIRKNIQNINNEWKFSSLNLPMVSYEDLKNKMMADVDEYAKRGIVEQRFAEEYKNMAP